MSATAATKKQKPLKRHPSKLKQASAYTILAIILISIVAVLFAFPLYWIITGSFKTGAAINATTPEWWPSQWVLTNYQKLFAGKSAPLWQLAVPFGSKFSADGEPIYFSVGPMAPAAIRWMINTVFMAVMSMILTCITAAMAGYALAKKRFVGRKLLFTLIVCAMALPKQVILIPLLREMSALNLYNTIWAVIFPIVGWPFGVFLMKQFSEGIPTEMLEAARIDGASEARTFVKIVLPMVKPGIGALAIFTFINSWNDYFMCFAKILMKAMYHSVQHQQPDHLAGHCKAAGREQHRLRSDHGRCRTGRRAYHHHLPHLPEVLHQGHRNGCGQRITFISILQKEGY